MGDLSARVLEMADRLDSIQNRKLKVFEALPEIEEFDHRIPLASGVQVITEDKQLQATHLALRWNSAPDPNIERFDLWVRRSAFLNEQPIKIAEAVRSPANISVTADRNTAVAIHIQTVLKNGLKSNVIHSPAVATNVEAQEVQLDRFIFQTPADTVVALDAGTQTVTGLDLTSQTGRLIDIGVTVSKKTGGQGTCDFWIDLTIDGTKKSIQIMFTDEFFGTSLDPWAARDNSGSANQLGANVHDSLLFPFDLTFNDSLKIEYREQLGAGWGGEMDLAFKIRYANLAAA